MAKSTKVEWFQSVPLADLFARLDSARTSLSAAEAKRRWQLYGPNRLRPSKRTDAVTLFAMIFVLLVTLALPYRPLSELLGFRPLALPSLILLGLITLLYFATSELAKCISGHDQ